MKLSPPGSLACISCSHASRSWRSVNPSASKNSGDHTQPRQNMHTPHAAPCGNRSRVLRAKKTPALKRQNVGLSSPRASSNIRPSAVVVSSK